MIIFRIGDRIEYWSVTRIYNPNGTRIIAKGVIEFIDNRQKFARVRRSDIEMPIQVVLVNRLKLQQAQGELPLVRGYNT